MISYDIFSLIALEKFEGYVPMCGFSIVDLCVVGQVKVA
jgi:hypothetical protein